MDYRGTPIKRLFSLPASRIALFSKKILASCVIVSLVLPVQVTSAQQINPSLLNQLDPALLKQVQGGVSGSDITRSETSPLDQARGSEGETSGTGVGGFNQSTPAEQELRNIQAQQQLDAVYQPTAIEKEYRLRTQIPNLKQFGYDLFRETPRRSAPITGRVGDDYILGVGDEVVVILQGSTSRNIRTRIDREGRLIVDQLQPILAAGRRFGDVRRDLEDQTHRTLLGTEVFFSVGNVRSISVIVGGEVVRPGQFSLTSLSDVSQALSYAGGVKRSGSLRNIRIDRGGQFISVDLYGLLGLGRLSQAKLQDGDRIIVPAIGRTIAVAGAVTRPGIFELSGAQTTVADAVAMGGGTLRPGGNDFIISRIDQNGQERVLSGTSRNEIIKAGDVLQIVPRERDVVGRVTLTGFVDSPGPRAVTIAPSVRALLGKAQNLKLGSYLPMAVLIRRDPVTSAPVFEGVNLINVFEGGQDVPLRSDDKLVLLSNDDVAFLQSATVRRIILGQPNPIPECRALEELQNLVQDTQSDRFSAAIRGSFLIAKGNRAELTGGAAAQSRLGVREAPTSIESNPTAQGAISKTDSTTGVTVVDEKAELEFQRRCPAIFNTEAGVLPFLLENSVVVGGSVRRPGAYPVWSEASAAVLMSVAGGLTSRSKSISLDITRLEGSDAEQVQNLKDMRDADLTAVKLAVGDDVRFGLPQGQFEPGAVLLTGEFARPGLYTIRKGEKLSELIKRAGGITPYAYAYGAVFTRRSVKQAQEEGFRRTARELNQALLAVSARKNISSDAIVAASQLAQSFATVEAPGRLVIEADPIVLEQRSDLDTVMESGDAIFMPKRPNYVLSLGDVLNPGALQFAPGKSVQEYLRETGGTQRSADEKRTFLVYPNGIALPVKRKGWLRSTNIVVPPGSSIVVPKDVDPLFKLDIIKDVATILGQFATSIASVAVLTR